MRKNKIQATILKKEYDLFYDNKYEKHIDKVLKKQQPIIKRVIKTIDKIASVTTDLLFCGLLISCVIPFGERKTQNEIENSIQMLEADNSYYSLVEVNMENIYKLKEFPKFYIPLVVPAGQEYIDIVVPSDFNNTAKLAIKDTLEEYNNILKAAKKDYRFLYCEDKSQHLCSINVKLLTLPGNMAGLNVGLTLPAGNKFGNQILLDPQHTNDYLTIRAIMTHELLHSFGIGDQYLVGDYTSESIMSGDICRKNFLESNDIKYIFATLYDIENQEDVNYVNNYINYHIQHFKINKTKNPIIEQEKE